MKLRFLSLTALCAAAFLLSLRAEESPNAPKAADTTKAPAEKAKKDHTELEEHMEELGKAFRRVNRQIKDASKNEDTLQQLALMRQHAEAGLKLEPAMKADIAAEKQAKFVTDYQAHMKSFIGRIAKLEELVKAGNNAEAETFIGSLKKDQKEGHTQFKRKDEKKS